MGYERKRNQTRELIVSTLIGLMCQKPLSKITVGDITQNAGINRSTFYKHYVDKVELIDSIVNQIVMELREIQERRAKRKMETDDDIIISIVESIEVYQKNSDFINAMLSENGDVAFERQLYQLTVEFTRDTIPPVSAESGYDSETREMIVQYQASALLGLTRYWLCSQQATPVDLAKLILTLKRDGTHTSHL